LPHIFFIKWVSCKVSCTRIEQNLQFLATRGWCWGCHTCRIRLKKNCKLGRKIPLHESIYCRRILTYFFSSWPLFCSVVSFISLLSSVLCKHKNRWTLSHTKSCVSDLRDSSFSTNRLSFVLSQIHLNLSYALNPHTLKL
jgi:hypothetical protein